MYQNKRVVVIGAARSGIAAARFLAARGAQVTISDSRSGSALDAARSQVGAHAVTWEEGGNRPETARAADLVVVSPGVPRENAALQAAQAAGVEVIGEVELAARHLRGPLVAITGSNGKSTTTVLTGEILRASGKQVFVGGNLGTPLIEAAEQPLDVVVAEISSFQLEWVRAFRPQVAAFLNISPNHLDRHSSFEEYLGCKLRLLSQQDEAGVSIYNAGDPTVATRAPAVIRGRALAFSSGEGAGLAGRIEAGALVLSLDGAEERYPLSALTLRGRHNHENALAALLLARAAGASEAGARAALASFRGLAHRLELLRVVDGVEYINDSKATSVAAAVTALESLPEGARVVLLLGGRDKGGSYAPLRPLLAARGRAVIAFGEAAPKIAEGLAGAAPLEILPDLATALLLARAQARPGDVVLLSPACSSFDQFANFEARGEAFRALVEAL